MTITRRATLAAPLALPVLASTLAAPAQDRVRAGQLAHLASNLRRAEDMARSIGAPLVTADAWRWIVQHVRTVDMDELHPLERADLIADIEKLGWEDQKALRRELAA